MRLLNSMPFHFAQLSRLAICCKFGGEKSGLEQEIMSSHIQQNPGKKDTGDTELLSHGYCSRGLAYLVIWRKQASTFKLILISWITRLIISKNEIQENI